LTATVENNHRTKAILVAGKGMKSMKISCDREQLLHAFQTVAGVAPTRSPKAILQNVKMEVIPDSVTLLATDLQLGIRHQVTGVDIQVPGQAVLSVVRFGSILRESTDHTLHLECDSTGVTVRGERSQFRLPAENPAEFPQVTAFEETSYYELPTRLLRELIRRTVFATDTESSRYALGGVKIEFGDAEVTSIGTDGRRLAKMAGPISKTGSPEAAGQNTIVPTRAMNLIERAIASSEGEVQIALKGNEILIHSQKATISAVLLEGRYPEWRKVIPESNPERVSLELAIGATHSAVRQAAIVTSEESRGVDFTLGDGMLVLSGRAAEVGQSRIEMPINYNGKDITVTLDPRYVTDFLKALDPVKTFSFEVKDSDSAALCRTDDGYAYVVMPLSRDR
jgi:DNA polymerase-3 subunit beta